MNSPSHPSVCPPSALCASWSRPAVAALAASGTDPPHFNASDIYLGRTTREREGGGEGLCTAQWMWILLMRISLTPPHPPPSWLRRSLRCVLLRRPCVRAVCVICVKSNGRASAVRFEMTWPVSGFFFWFFLSSLPSWIAAVCGRRLSNEWDVASISSHVNDIKGPACCPHYGCSSHFWDMLSPAINTEVRLPKWCNNTLKIQCVDAFSGQSDKMHKESSEHSHISVFVTLLHKVQICSDNSCMLEDRKKMIWNLKNLQFVWPSHLCQNAKLY